MAKELIISSNRHETKVALFEDEQLVEMYFQRADEYSLAGSIHKGRVTRVLPGMQSAFVNIGLERDAFLYVSDFFEESEEEFEKTPVAVKERSRSPRVVDEDTGEPSDESNERFATAQTVASLVTEQELGSDDVESDDAEVGELADTPPPAKIAAGVAPAGTAVLRTGSAAQPQGGEFSDDRRGRRRRRRRGRGGAGLPESKFADGTPRPEGRAPRREEDEDSRWNRKPTAAALPKSDFEDDDPPQSVMIAKVSDPNRLPPPPRRTREEFGSAVLPGESLAKYRRQKGSESRSDFADRKPEPRADHDDSAGGGRYSQPRKSRHGTRGAGFLAPADEDAPSNGGSEESESFDLMDGQSASLFPPDDAKIYLAVKADDGDGESAEDAPAKAAAKAPAKKAAKKRSSATKTSATARKRASKTAAAPDEAGTPSGDSEDGDTAQAGAKPARKPRSRAKAKAAPVDAETTEADPTELEAPENGAPANLAPESEEPAVELVAESTVSEDEREAALGRSDFEDDDEDENPTLFDGAEVSFDGDGTDEGDEEAAGDEDSSDEESGAEATATADGGQRLSRRERRRLRMIEKREERRRDRDVRRPDGAPATEGTELVTTAPGVDRESRPEREGRTDREPRPEREGRPQRDARPERDGRPQRDARTGDRDGRGERDSRGDRDNRGDRETRGDRGDRSRGKALPSAAPLISEVLKEGQEILVQIAKEPLGQKGARITSHIALPGRYVVYMPTVEHVGVSRKVGTDNERLRLRKILQSGREGMPGGFICRTAAEGRTEEEIHADMQFLNTLWQETRSKADKSNSPALIHHDLDIVQRVLRDQLTEEFKTIWVDNEELYERILRFVQNFQPSLVSRVRLYTKPAPIFDTFNVTAELEKALRPKVWLKSGGYIVINQTEALVAIDVNTGKFVGKSNRLEDTIVKTNLEAVKEAVRQIRLRDLGGIIVVDFIDMDERRNRQKVMQALDEAMKEDRAPYKILQFNDFGLVAITRKRVKQSLERTLCQPCPYCEGAAYIKNVQTVIGEILTEAQKIAKAVEGEVSLRVNPEVGKVLKSHTNNYLEELEEILKVPVIVTSDALLHQEKFDLA